MRDEVHLPPKYGRRLMNPLGVDRGIQALDVTPSGLFVEVRWVVTSEA